MAHIAILITNMSGGGAERVTLSLVAGFLARGHRVTLLLGRKEGPFLADVPASVEVVDCNAKRLRHVVPPVVRALRRLRPDVLLANLWPLTIAGILASKLAGVGTRVVTVDHSTLSKHLELDGKSRLGARMMLRIFYPLAHARIAVSGGVADDLADFSGLPRDRFRAVPNPIGAPARAGETDDDATIADPEWLGASCRFLAVGNLKAAKDYPTMLRALARLPASLDWHLMVLGDGEYRPELERLAHTLGIVSRVTFAGFVIATEPYFRRATMLLLSSVLEGLPTVLVEALHHGLPIVTTDCRSGPREILQDGQLGPLVEPGDDAAFARAILATIERPVAPERLKARAGDYLPDKIVDEYLSIMLRDAKN